MSQNKITCILLCSLLWDQNILLPNSIYKYMVLLRDIACWASLKRYWIEDLNMESQDYKVDKIHTMNPLACSNLRTIPTQNWNSFLDVIYRLIFIKTGMKISCVSFNTLSFLIHKVYMKYHITWSICVVQMTLSRSWRP